MTDGQMEIIVYSYEGQLNRQSIGRVYVEDKDDWDLASKSFSMKSHKYFSIDNQGQITIEADTPAGYYNFDSDVYDNERKESAKGSVKVVVRAFSQPAFENQAAIRIQYNPKVEKLSDFLDKRDAFVNLLKKIVFDSKDDSRTVDVDIFSIQPSEFDPTMYDVRFTVSYAHRFLSKTIVEGLIAAHLGEFKRELNKDTITVGIDMCLVTRCDNGCQTKHTASNVSYFLVILILSVLLYFILLFFCFRVVMLLPTTKLFLLVFTLLLKTSVNVHFPLLLLLVLTIIVTTEVSVTI